MTASPVQLGLLMAIHEAGSQSELARRLRVKRQVVGGWVRRGRVPGDWVERVVAETGVDRAILRPDLYWPAG